MRSFLSWRIYGAEEDKLRRELADRDLSLANARRLDAEKSLERALAEIDKWRGLYDAERYRADQQLDGLMRQVGMPEVTAAASEREEKHMEAAQKAAEKQIAELGEMFSEQIGDGIDLLPDELRAEALKLMGKDANA